MQEIKTDITSSELKKEELTKAIAPKEPDANQILDKYSASMEKSKLFDQLQNDIKTHKVIIFAFYWFKPGSLTRDKERIKSVFKNNNDEYFIKFKKEQPMKFKTFAGLWEFLINHCMVKYKED